MAINKKLIHFKTRENFEKEKDAGNILDTSICFIKDSQQIYTHGLLYDCKNSPFKVKGLIYDWEGESNLNEELPYFNELKLPSKVDIFINDTLYQKNIINNKGDNQYTIQINNIRVIIDLEESILVVEGVETLNKLIIAESIEYLDFVELDKYLPISIMSSDTPENDEILATFPWYNNIWGKIINQQDAIDIIEQSLSNIDLEKFKIYEFNLLYRIAADSRISLEDYDNLKQAILDKKRIIDPDSNLELFGYISSNSIIIYIITHSGINECTIIESSRITTRNLYENFNGTNNGLVPKPSTMSSTLFLNASGSWTTPSPAHTSLITSGGTRRAIMGAPSNTVTGNISMTGNYRCNDVWFDGTGKLGANYIDIANSATIYGTLDAAGRWANVHGTLQLLGVGDEVETQGMIYDNYNGYTVYDESGTLFSQGNRVLNETNVPADKSTTSANAVTSTANRTYQVQLNSNNKLVVNVPWEKGEASAPGATYEVFGKNSDGLVPGYSTDNSILTTSGWIGLYNPTTTPTLAVSYSAAGFFRPLVKNSAGVLGIIHPTYAAYNTDTNVTQNKLTATGSYPLLMSAYTKDTTTTTATSVNRVDSLYATKDGELYANSLIATNYVTASESITIDNDGFGLYGPGNEGYIVGSNVVVDYDYNVYSKGNLVLDESQVNSSNNPTLTAHVITSEEADRTYAVQKNANGKLVVNVPWEAGENGLTYEVFGPNKNGLVPGPTSTKAILLGYLLNTNGEWVPSHTSEIASDTTKRAIMGATNNTSNSNELVLSKSYRSNDVWFDGSGTIGAINVEATNSIKINGKEIAKSFIIPIIEVAPPEVHSISTMNIPEIVYIIGLTDEQLSNLRNSIINNLGNTNIIIKMNSLGGDIYMQSFVSYFNSEIEDTTITLMAENSDIKININLDTLVSNSSVSVEYKDSEPTAISIDTINSWFD